MTHAGKIVLTRFPHTDLSGAKLRPVLMLRPASRYGDWLVCMVSSRLEQAQAHLDEVVATTDSDYSASGLKVVSVLRLSRLAVLDAHLLTGSIGTIGTGRMKRVRERLAQWIASDDESEFHSPAL